MFSNRMKWWPLTCTNVIPGNRISTPEPHRPDPDEVVTRTHWQRSGYNDLCTEPACGKRLGPVNGSVNCRKCGRLFCEDHTMYQMKLSRSAQHEPVRGFWCRVCETCFKSRDGYNDHGFIRDHTNDFLAMRRKNCGQAILWRFRGWRRGSRNLHNYCKPTGRYVTTSNGRILSWLGKRTNGRYWSNRW
jgi:rabenosyn-5